MIINLEELKNRYQDWNTRFGLGDCTLCGEVDEHYEDCWWLVIGELISEVEKLRVQLAAALQKGEPPSIEEMSGIVDDMTEGKSLKDYLEDSRK